MNKIWLVLTHEIETIVRSRSFILTLILVPFGRLYYPFRCQYSPTQ